MGRSLTSFTQGWMELVVGPVKSGKSGSLISSINSFRGAINKEISDKELLVVKHPNDDKDLRHKISSFHKENIDAIECETADELVNLVNKNTKYIFISGIHLFDKNIVDLCDELVMSNRKIVASGINLTYDGKPYGNMPELMAMADSYEIKRPICKFKFCSEEAYRTQKTIENKFEPRCLTHYSFKNRPDYKPFLTNQMPSLEIVVGPMFSGKTNDLFIKVNQLKSKDNVAIFKWNKDKRYSHKYIISHNKDKIPAINIENAEEIKSYLEKHKEIGYVIIDEIQFIEGSYNLVNNLLYQGYQIFATGLKRDFRRKPFGDVPKLLTIADNIINKEAYCYKCGHPATETQRIITKNGADYPASYDDPTVLVGGKESYKAACRLHHKIKNAPENKYNNRFNKIRI